MQKIILRLISFLGCSIFLLLLLMTFANRQMLESSAYGVLKAKLHHSIEQKLEKVSLALPDNAESTLAVLSKKIQQKADEKIDKYKSTLLSIIDDNLARVQKSDCECRLNWKEKLTRSTELNVKTLEEMKTALIDFSHAKYMEMIERLLRDVRIVFGVNAFLFGIILAISWFKPQNIQPLFIPSALMIISSVALVYGCFFHPSWFYTLFFNNVAGLSYGIYTLIVIAFIADVAINHAKISRFLLPSSSTR